MAATPLDYLHGNGDKAYPVVSLTWGVLIISIVVIAIISLLVAGAIWRRPGIAPAPGQILRIEPHGSALSWLWIGVGVSTLVLRFSMPAFPVLSNKDLADVASYVRNAWGNRAGAVSAKQAEQIREFQRQ